MDFLFISDNDWTSYGGSEVMWSETAIQLNSMGYDVAVYAKQWPNLPPHYIKLQNAGCKIFYRKERFSRLWLKHNLFNALIEKLNLWFINPYKTNDFWKEFLVRKNPKLLVLSLGNQNDGLTWSQLALENDISYVLLVQLVIVGQTFDDTFNKRLSQQYLRAKKIFFCSEQNKKQLEIQLAEHLSNGEISFNPIPQDVPRLNIDNSKKSVFSLAMVASLSIAHKAHDLLFEVLSKEKWRERPLKVNLYGTGHTEKIIKKQAKFFKLDNIQFHGYEDNKANIWSENSGLILCSRMEGMSLAILEALAHERIVITTNLGGANEIIQDNITGFIADHPSVEAIDQVLERAWVRRQDWMKMGMVAKKHLDTVIPFDPVLSLTEKIHFLLGD